MADVNAKCSRERIKITKQLRYNLCLITQRCVANFPDHPPSDITHVRLAEVECFLASGQTRQELTGKYTAIIAVLLLRSVLCGNMNDQRLANAKTRTVQGECGPPTQ
jgi:hypothetical protein